MWQSSRSAQLTRRSLEQSLHLVLIETDQRLSAFASATKKPVRRLSRCEEADSGRNSRELLYLAANLRPQRSADQLK